MADRLAALIETVEVLDPKLGGLLQELRESIEAIQEQREPDFFDLARREMARAREKFPNRQSGLHEGYAVLLEEVDELWECVKAQRADQDPHHILVECIQVAAMAGRMAEDRGLMAAIEMPSAGGSGDLITQLLTHDPED